MIKKLLFITVCIAASQFSFSQEIIINEPVKNGTYKPLDQIKLSLNSGNLVEVVDGKGTTYFSEKVQPEISFAVGGFPGYHHILLRNNNHNIIDDYKFFVECETQISTDDIEFNQLFDRLKWNIFKPGEAKIVRYNDQSWFLMSDWLRDHVNILKGKKYFSHELKDAIDLFAENQLDNGMVFDFCMPAGKNFWVERFSNRDFIDLREDEGHVFQRVPVENDVEFWFVMGIFYTWQATGDDTWMKERLINAEKALQYNMTSPFVWSEKYQLIKRPFTIDTWDFTPKDDAALVGGDNMESIPGKSRYGIMHGDNTGFAKACKMLSTMFAYTGDSKKADQWEEVSFQILDRLNELAWNGKFYTHYVDEEEGVTRDMGVDLETQISLSNAFALNRGIDYEKATQIIETYKNIRSNMPEKSPGEFYAIYPPFKKGFNINEWHYVNGGVFPFIGGELALGAYEHGEESYASDILLRMNQLLDIDDGNFPYYYIGNIPQRPETNFTPISVKGKANVDFSGKGAKDVPGWTGEGIENDLSDMPPGKQFFEGVPYQIVDPKQNQNRGCIGLSKTEQYQQSATLEINKKAQSIYFLHTMAGTGMAGWIDIHYTDGATHREYVESGNQLNNWWNPMDGKYSRVTGWAYKKAWSYNNGRSEVGVYQWGLDNPHPDKEIEKIEFQHALNSTKWFILGITLSDQPVYFKWPKSTGTHLVNWNAGAVMRAYIEGLAGVKDNLASFKNVTISPRWSSAEINQASVTIKYPASDEYIKYIYKADAREINLHFTGSYNASEIKVLMPASLTPEVIFLDGTNVDFRTEKLGNSSYAVVNALSNSGVHRMRITLQQNQPRTWWRWLNGNISKEGITKDLEAIKAKGMSGVTLFNLGAYYPKGDVSFLSEEWLELFDFSVDECKRIGLDFSFQMCDGWGASGGPWVTKDHAMKFVTSSKVTVKGGKLIEINLPQPHTKLDYYKDIKVLAFPAIDTSTHSFTAENVQVKFNGWVIDPENLIDGDRYSYSNFGFKNDEEHVIDFVLNKSAVFSAINIHQGPRETPVGPQKCEIQYSHDGEKFTTLAVFIVDDIKGGTEFERVKAKYFRLKIVEWTPSTGNGGWAFLSEVELLSPDNITKFPKLNDFENKASVLHRRRGLAESINVPDTWLINREDILDITKYYTNGKLNWQVPEGHWTVVRMGYTLTGKKNGPATEEGTGLECDKLSTAAVDVFYDGYAGKMLKRNMEHTGKTITRLFADSFEALAQNWTPKMQEAFEKRTGYSIDNFLLVLSGEIVESVEISERFLYDLRKVLSEMLAENYYAQLNKRCHEDNVKFVAQAGGEQQMLANPILYSAQVDFPATEFWIDANNFSFRTNGSFYDAVSAAHVYGHNIIPTESFTTQINDFSITPAIMKPLADKAFAYGVNQIEMHTYIHQPDDKLPGLQHNGFGISWGRKITWWDAAAGELSSYFSRCQNLLQLGNTVADILLYTGEEIPNSLEFAYNVHDPYTLIPQGYKFDAINSQVLQDMVSMKDGLYTLPNGLQYKVLVLPPSKKMSLSVLQKIQSFVKAGGIVVGQQPTQSFGMAHAEKDMEIKELAESLWKSDHIYENTSLREVFEKENIRQDFDFHANTDAEILFLHKIINKQEVYFLSNQSNAPVSIDATFRQSKKIPEIWDAESEDIIPQKIYTEKDSTISMPLHFGSMESKFVIFSDGEKVHITGIEKDGKQLYPFSQAKTELPIFMESTDSLVFSQIGNYTIENSNGKSREVKISSIPKNLSIEAPFTVSFDEKWGAPKSVTFDKLISWTEHPDTGIKYYSGTAVYENEFSLSNKQTEENLKITMDLGKVKDVAEVYINGKKVKVLLYPDFSCDISNLVKKGKNKLEIHVTNTWNNRIAGDDMNPDKERFTFYPVIGYSPDVKPKKFNEKDLLESGLMGPVVINFSVKH